MDNLLPTVTRIEHTVDQGPVATILDSPFQDAVAAIAKLQTDMKTSISTINAAYLGPYNLGGSCDYDCILGVCWKTYHWHWNLDFEYLRAPLQAAVQQVGSAAGQFTTAFQPARDWLKVTLPQFSAEFANQSNTILTTNAAIVKAGGVATAAQIATLQAAFADIISGLDNGRQQIQTSTSVLASFNEMLNSCVSQVTQLASEQEGYITNWVQTTWNNFVNGMDCGQGDADTQVNDAIATFIVFMGQIQSSFKTLQADTGAVSTATDQLVGIFVNINDQYGLVAGQISLSQAYPAGAISDLHLDIAASEWAQLAQYAQKNIQ